MINPIPVLALSLLTLALAAYPARAQQNQGGDLSQSRQGGGIQQNGLNQHGGSAHKAQTAQVGAGTTDSSTTAYSGPKDSSQQTPGQNELPPLPRPELCTSYQDMPTVYQSCLWVTLRK